jgi:double-strand break repair protein MRE11
MSTQGEIEELRILVTTDNHLGYLERDPIRGEDSFEAFEEVLEHAREAGADALLIGGDLFHESVPSKYTLFKTMELFRRHCFGDNPVAVECKGDMDRLLRRPAGSKQGRHVLNYRDRNMNISLPVFVINGNHDEPSGYGGVSPLDILAEAGLVNYFGRSECVGGKIEIGPLEIKKGRTRVNVYGAGAIRDERMCRAFAEGKVIISEASRGKGLNLFVIHQNRSGHRGKSYIAEGMLKGGMDIIIWGHEHESRPHPEYNEKMKFHVIQPGSTVQTSLSESEAGDKHCILLRVRGQEWSSIAIKVERARQFVFRRIKAGGTAAERAVIANLREMVAERRGEKLPLVRLRVELEGSGDVIVQRRLTEAFRNAVANPGEMLRIKRERRKGKVLVEDGLSKKRAHCFLEEVHDAKVLPGFVFTKSIAECIERGDKNAIFRAYEEITGEMEGILRKYKWTDIDVEMDNVRNEMERKARRLSAAALLREGGNVGETEEAKENISVREEALADLEICVKREEPGTKRVRLEEEDLTFVDLL